MFTKLSAEKESSDDYPRRLKKRRARDWQNTLQGIPNLGITRKLRLSS
ncbi:MAG: hypothetical protein V3U87_06010 [Methylococcaceae bacterium]